MRFSQWFGGGPSRVSARLGRIKCAWFGAVAFPDHVHDSGATGDLLAQKLHECAWLRSEVGLFDGKISEREQRALYGGPDAAQVGAGRTDEDGWVIGTHAMPSPGCRPGGGQR